MELDRQQVNGMTAEMMEQKIYNLQKAIVKMPQYQPVTRHTFFGGMYCREVFREAGVCIVGRVHKKEHFYYIVSGTVAITTDEGVQSVTGPHLLCCKPGTKRAVYAVTDALCMTFHVSNAKTVEEAELELVEEDPDSMYSVGNIVKDKLIEVQP